MDRGVIANLISFPITEIQFYKNSCVLGGIPNFTFLVGFKHIITGWGNYGSQCESGISLLCGVFSIGRVRSGGRGSFTGKPGVVHGKAVLLPH